LPCSGPAQLDGGVIEKSVFKETHTPGTSVALVFGHLSALDRTCLPGLEATHPATSISDLDLSRAEGRRWRRGTRALAVPD
jgi:hypothetical protein